MVLKSYLLLIITCISLVNFNARAGQKTVTVALDTYPPYSNPMTENNGVLAELLKQAFQQQQIDTHIEFKLWANIEESLSTGNFLTIFWTTNRVLRRNQFFSDPVLFVNNQLVSIKPTTRHYQNLGQLKDSKIGITKGFSYGSVFDGFKPDLSIVEFDTRFTGLRALINGKIDYLLIDPLVAKQLMASYFQYRTDKKLFYLDSLEFEAQPAYLVCSKNYANCEGLLKQFEQGLQSLKKSNQYQKILSF